MDESQSASNLNVKMAHNLFEWNHRFGRCEAAFHFPDLMLVQLELRNILLDERHEDFAQIILAFLGQSLHLLYCLFKK